MFKHHAQNAHHALVRKHDGGTDNNDDIISFSCTLVTTTDIFRCVLVKPSASRPRDRRSTRAHHRLVAHAGEAHDEVPPRVHRRLR
jgi:hypothetical protein